MPISERKYSVSEIDRMRVALEIALRTGMGRHSYYTATPDAVERQLRTYMLAGVEPEELEAKAAAWERAWNARNAEPEYE